MMLVARGEGQLTERSFLCGRPCGALGTLYRAGLGVLAVGRAHPDWGCGEMADAGDLKSFDLGREGSNPSIPTILEKGLSDGKL